MYAVPYTDLLTDIDDFFNHAHSRLQISVIKVINYKLMYAALA